MTEVENPIAGAEDPPSPPPPPTEAAVAAAYQVTARLLSAEGQMIWNRTTVLIAFNAAAFTAAGAITEPWVRLGLPLVGFLYCLLSYLAFLRAFAYRDLEIVTLRDQEASLRLGGLGFLTRGHEQQAQIPGIRATRVVRITTVLFSAAYFALFIRGMVDIFGESLFRS